MRCAVGTVIALALLFSLQACMNTPADKRTVTLDRKYWSKVRHRDLYDAPLWPAVCDLVQWTAGQESYEQAQLRTAREMPQGLRYYFFIMRLDGRWGNGGMQAVVLSDDPAGSWELVEGAAEALRFHGSHAKAKVLDELLAVVKMVEPKLQAALDRDAAESELQKLWDQIDVFDKRYDKADPDIDVYARIVRHAHQHPDEYVPKGSAERGRFTERGRAVAVGGSDSVDRPRR
jgi:hypothetical protein